MELTKPLDLQTPNGNEMNTSNGQTDKFSEVGSPGLPVYSGYVSAAYIPELYWPACIPIYDKIYRSDPEVTMVRILFASWGGKLKVEAEVPPEVEKPTDDDKRALDFSYSVLDEMDGGGLDRWLVNAVTQTPLYGWKWNEVPLGVRKTDWRPPGEDDWRSKSEDGLIGYRRLANRHYSSWHAWDINEDTGKLYGMKQFDIPNPVVTIPLDRSLHLTFGDSDNPEGLATMEALYRLERYKYSLEVIQGIGFEHAGGHLNVDSEDKLTPTDHDLIRRAARMIMSVQPGNYMAWPKHLKGQLVDVPFGAAPSLLEAIRYYSILKLALLGMGWLANAGGISGVGSFANVKDGSEMGVLLFNAMASDFVRQADEQIWARLFTYPVNKAAFPNLTRRPRLKLIPIDKDVPLSELGQLLTALQAIMPLGDEDYLAIRRKTGFLPEALPEVVSPVAVQPESEAAPETEDSEQDAEEDAAESLEGDGTPEMDDSELSELAAPVKTIEEKIKDMPQHYQDEIEEYEREFQAMRKGWRKQNRADIENIPEKAWDEAMQKDLENETQEL